MAIDPIRVFLVEDHDLVRAGLRQLLESSAEIRVVGEAASAEEAFSLLKESLPQVLVLDVPAGNQRPRRTWPFPAPAAGITGSDA